MIGRRSNRNGGDAPGYQTRANVILKQAMVAGSISIFFYIFLSRNFPVSL
jgi:hypothetical protein